MENCQICKKPMDKGFVIVSIDIYKILSTINTPENRSLAVCNRLEQSEPPVCSTECTLKLLGKIKRNIQKKVAEAEKSKTSNSPPSDPNGC